MSVPSVTKITKNGVEFTSSVDRANYYLYELTRTALYDACKYVRKQYMKAYYTEFTKHSGKGKKAISYKVYASKNTKKPRAEIGIKHSTPSLEVPGFYTYFHELGTKKEKAHQLLKRITEESIDTIVQIESQYLSGIEDESTAQSMIDEAERDVEATDSE